MLRERSSNPRKFKRIIKYRRRDLKARGKEGELAKLFHGLPLAVNLIKLRPKMVSKLTGASPETVYKIKARLSARMKYQHMRDTTQYQ